MLDQQPSTRDRDRCLDPLDQLVDPVGLQDGVVVADIALVVDLDQDVAVAVVEQPVHALSTARTTAASSRQSLVLAEVEDAEDHDHAELVGPVEDLRQAGHVVGPKRAVGVIAELCQGCSRQ